MNESFFSYENVSAALKTLSSLGNAADTHGLLTAMFVSGIAIRPKAWLDSLLTQQVDLKDPVSKNAVQVLEKLFAVTQKSLESIDFEFNLLLPDDEYSLEDRIEALSAWCQSFIAGLNLVGVRLDTLSVGASQEAFEDLVKMSCLIYDEEISGDVEDEADYTELVEYARTAVMLLYEEIHEQVEKTASYGVVH